MTRLKTLAGGQTELDDQTLAEVKQVYDPENLFRVNWNEIPVEA